MKTDRIILLYCEAFGLSPAQITTLNKEVTVTKARNMIALASQIAGNPRNEIANALQRTPSAISAMWVAAQNSLDTERPYREKYEKFLTLVSMCGSARERVHVADVRTDKAGTWILFNAANAPAGTPPTFPIHKHDIYILERVPNS